MRTVAAALTAAALLLTACTSDGSEPSPAGPTTTSAATTPVDEPVEDRVYPEVGDPGVDVLSYHLDLDWDPASQTLTGSETVRLRATARAPHIQLDLGDPLEVVDVEVAGMRVRFDHVGKDLVIHQPVAADRRYLVHIDYAGTPEAVPAPTERTDIANVGWTVSPSGQVWTMQEPFGAYTWYAVNDQPSDKATYSFRISAPVPAVGVANGELVSRRERDGTTITAWELRSPASSYLVTIAIGEFTMTEDESASGLPMSYWTPADQPELIERMREAPAAVDWLEERLGPFPFDSLGYLVVDSTSGMETQTMITLGDTKYATSPEVLVHEAAHQWYGDLVTPRDWRDVWMNEGMAMYLQGVWTAEHRGPELDELMAEWATYDASLRGDSGPPAAFDPEDFGAANVYYIPAVMWHELREQIGDEEFWRLVREWPEANAFGNAGYDDITAWWSEQTGEDLSAFFDEWLLSEQSPSAEG